MLDIHHLAKVSPEEQEEAYLIRKEAEKDIRLAPPRRNSMKQTA